MYAMCIRPKNKHKNKERKRWGLTFKTGNSHNCLHFSNCLVALKTGQGHWTHIKVQRSIEADHYYYAQFQISHLNNIWENTNTNTRVLPRHKTRQWSRLDKHSSYLVQVLSSGYCTCNNCIPDHSYTRLRFQRSWPSKVCTSSPKQCPRKGQC